MLKKTNGVTGEVTMVPTTPEGRVSVDELISEFDEQFKGAIQLKDRPDGVTVIRFKHWLRQTLTAERTRHAEEKERLVRAIQQTIPHQLGCIWHKTNVVLGKGTCTCIKNDIKEIAAKFNIDVK